MTAPDVTTVTDIRRAFAKRGLRPRKRLGQNFLIDRNLLACAADAAELSPEDTVLEVGAGTGSLTRILAERASRVVSIEVDRGLHTLASEVCADRDNVRLILGDAMAGDRLSAEATEALADAQPLKLVANLPYVISTALMKALIVHGPRPRILVVTVQSEVADRMAAEPGTRDYGLLTVLLQANGEVERLRTLPPSVFWPRPKVTSALVRVRLREAPEIDAGALVRVAGGLIGHRRKQLAGAMRLAGFAASAADAEDRLRSAGLDPRSRPDGLTVAEYVRLTGQLEGEPDDPPQEA